MPRPLRIHYEGAWYHVMNRGANHDLIYFNDFHRKEFLSLLYEVVKQYQVEVHAYCLMGNHYHLLLKTPLANLSRCMRHVDGIYTQRFNRDVCRDGPLFRGRYKSILIEENNYLLQVSRYIHLNPVEASLCQHPESYEWSSYQYFIGKCAAPVWLSTDFTLGQMGNQNQQEKYCEFVRQGNNKDIRSIYANTKIPSILGSREYVEQNLKRVDDAIVPYVQPDINRTASYPGVELILACIMEHYQATEDAFKKSSHGSRNWVRILAAYFLRRLTPLTNLQIARILNLNSIGYVSTLVSRCQKELDASADFARQAEAIKWQIMDKYDHC